MSKPLTFLCVATFFKGADFIRTAKALGANVFVITKKSLEHEAWPRECIDEFFYLEHDNNTPDNMDILREGLAYVMRSRKIDRVVSLDDFDVEKAAFFARGVSYSRHGANNCQVLPRQIGHAYARAGRGNSSACIQRGF